MNFNINTNCETIFFRNYKDFNNFNNITKEKICLINNLVDEINYKYMNKPSASCVLTKEQKKYIYALEYLNTTKNNEILKTFDEKLLFLIKFTDPECKLYQLFVKLNEDKNDTDIIKKIRYQFGFFSHILLEFEEKFYIKNYLLTTVNKDYSKHLMALLPLIKDLENISEERFIEITETVSRWKEIPNNKCDFQTCIFNILYQSHLLNLHSPQEKIVFFINAIDPNLLMFKIYNEECLYPIIEKRITERFGFYFQKLIKIEKLYNQRFGNRLQKEKNRVKKYNNNISN